MMIEAYFVPFQRMVKRAGWDGNNGKGTKGASFKLIQVDELGAFTPAIARRRKTVESGLLRIFLIASMKQPANAPPLGGAKDEQQGCYHEITRFHYGKQDDPRINGDKEHKSHAPIGVLGIEILAEEAKAPDKMQPREE